MVNLQALKSAAEDFFETEVLNIRALKDSKNTRIYLLDLEATHDADLPKEVVARIFMKPRLSRSVDSEVATINFLAAHTQIPVARVFFHEPVVGNAVGGQYIIQERIYGEALQKALDEEDEPDYELTLDAWHNLVDDYASIVSQLFRIRFDTIGSLYEVPVSDKDSDWSEVETFVGPTSESWFYRGRRRSLENLDVGPWESSSDWLAGLISNEVRYLRTYPRHLEKELQDEISSDDPLDLGVEWALNDAEERLRRLISLCNLGGGELGPDEALVRLSRTFGLFHAHLLPHNILIDTQTGRIKGITGWEDASITPVWRIASIPYWLEWPAGPESEWDRSRGHGKEDSKPSEVYTPSLTEDGRRNGVTEEELADLRASFSEKVAFEDPEGLFSRCLEDGFFDQIKIIPHLLYNIWDRDQVDAAIEELENWEAQTFP